MLQLDSENADRNLTSLVTVLTHTPDASNARLCVGYVAFGDGSKNLSAEGGDFELTIEVGGQTIQPSPQTITFGAVARAAAFTFQFPVPANASVVIKALSPNAGDTDVDVTARLYDAHVITPERAGYLDNINNSGLQTTIAQTGDAYAIVNSGTHGNAALKTLIDAVQADLPQRITKNTALSAFPFTMVSSTDHVTGATGLTVTATRSLDGGAFGACANAVSEVSNGVYKIDLAAGDLNGNTVVLKFTATGADARLIHLVTQPT